MYGVVGKLLNFHLIKCGTLLHKTQIIQIYSVPKNNDRQFEILTLSTLGYFFSRLRFEILFSPEQDLTLKTICMKCQILFSGKIRKLSSICHLLNLLREWLRLKTC